MADTLSQGCQVLLSDKASPEVYTAIGSAQGFSFGNVSRTVHETTTLADTAKTFAAGMLDNGELSVQYKFQASDAQLVDVWDAVISGVVQNWQVKFSDSPQTTFTFSGYVVGFPIDVSTDSLVQGSFNVKISGDITDNLA